MQHRQRKRSRGEERVKKGCRLVFVTIVYTGQLNRPWTLYIYKVGVVLSLKESKPLPNHVKMCFRSVLDLTKSSKSKCLINSSGRQTRWSTYVYRSGRREKRNGAVRSCIWENWETCNHPSMLSGCLDDRNMMESILHFVHFLVSISLFSYLRSSHMYCWVRPNAAQCPICEIVCCFLLI
jgi:hypothetical protein